MTTQRERAFWEQKIDLLGKLDEGARNLDRVLDDFAAEEQEGNGSVEDLFLHSASLRLLCEALSRELEDHTRERDCD